MSLRKIIAIASVQMIFVVYVSGQDISAKSTNNDNIQSNTITIPTLLVNGESTHEIAKVYRIAIGDISGNIQYHQSGVLEQKEPTLFAGLRYGKPWTRDAAINIWNGFGLLSKEVSKNTLLAQVKKGKTGKRTITGQYWDKVIWTIGAWNYYLYTGDKEFLRDAYVITQNTLVELEKDEFSSELGLFRGPAVYGDGVSAYPKIYTNHQEKEKTGSYSGIYQWAEMNDSLKHKTGYGMPMHVLSTNAVYYKAYRLLNKFAKALNEEPHKEWQVKADNLERSINKHFWNTTKENYDYLIDPYGNSNAQESLGIAFSLLFGIADEEKIDNIFANTVVEPEGIPCVYPSFERYRNKELDSYGRHSGTVWTHVQGFWADAAMEYNRPDVFLHEFKTLTKHVIRDNQFVEIYHPTKGTPYGGIQEPTLNEWEEWFCADRQTWSATAYLSMIFKNIYGMKFSEEGIKFNPFLPPTVNSTSLLGLEYRDAILNINISKLDSIESDEMTINGETVEEFHLSKDIRGTVNLEIRLSNN